MFRLGKPPRRGGPWLAAALLLAAPAAQAGRVEFSAGRSWTLLPRHYTAVAFAEWIGDPVPVWRLRFAPAFALGHFAPRPNPPNARLDHAVWLGAAGARLYLWRSLYLGFALATSHGKTDALSTPYEFMSSLGWQGGHWQVMFRHVSNGDLHEPNHGETMLLAGLAF